MNTPEHANLAVRNGRALSRTAHRHRFVIVLTSIQSGQSTTKQIRLSPVAFYSALCFMVIIAVGFLATAVLFVSTDAHLEQAHIQLEKSVAASDSIRADIERLASAAHELDAMIGSMTASGQEQTNASPAVAVPIRFDRRITLEPQTDLEYVEQVLQSAQVPFQNISGLLSAQNELLFDIPSVWPLENNHGLVTLEFGPNRHPKTNQWYLHKGIDIAGAYGVTVLASASGKVIEAGYDRTGYGNYILLRHKYGFRTRYSHLSNMYVVEGQNVDQGEPIGALGNTGISTGPHLDFQIILGTDVIDPVQFLQISRQQFQRWSGNR